MKEVQLVGKRSSLERGSLLACVATVLELSPNQLPRLSPNEDPARGGTISRWLNGKRLGLAEIANPQRFSWPGPWIARVSDPDQDTKRFVVMYGVPSGVVWDPGGSGELGQDCIQEGFLISATDIALWSLPHPTTSVGIGTVEGIFVSSAAGARLKPLQQAIAVPGAGLEGDRHALGTGTFPSGVPGSALTLIAAEVCESFEPPLTPEEHRRNVVTRGIDLNALVGREFTVGDVRCRALRLCEPCRVAQSYSDRPILRPLVHRGGLRADILEEGSFGVGDRVSLASGDAQPADVLV